MVRLISELFARVDRLGDTVDFPGNILDMHRSIFSVDQSISRKGTPALSSSA